MASRIFLVFFFFYEISAQTYTILDNNDPAVIQMRSSNFTVALQGLGTAVSMGIRVCKTLVFKCDVAQTDPNVLKMVANGQLNDLTGDPLSVSNILGYNPSVRRAQCEVIHNVSYLIQDAITKCSLTGVGICDWYKNGCIDVLLRILRDVLTTTMIKVRSDLRQDFKASLVQDLNNSNLVLPDNVKEMINRESERENESSNDIDDGAELFLCLKQTVNDFLTRMCRCFVQSTSTLPDCACRPGSYSSGIGNCDQCPDGKISGIGFKSCIPVPGKIVTTMSPVSYCDSYSLTNVISWSPDNSMISLSGCTGPPLIWDARTGAKVTSIPFSGNQVNSIQWDPSGKYLSVAEITSVVKLWNLVDKKWNGSLNVTASEVAWSSDGKFISVVYGSQEVGGFTVYNVATLSAYTENRKSGLSLRFSPNPGTLAFVSTLNKNYAIQVWVNDGTSFKISTKIDIDTAVSIIWSPDGKMILDSNSNLWSSESGVLIQNLKIVNGAWSPFLRYLSGASFVFDLLDPKIGVQGHIGGAFPKYALKSSWNGNGTRIAILTSLDSSSKGVGVYVLG